MRYVSRLQNPRHDGAIREFHHEVGRAVIDGVREVPAEAVLPRKIVTAQLPRHLPVFGVGLGEVAAEAQRPQVAEWIGWCSDGVKRIRSAN